MCVSQRWLYSIATIVIILTALSAMTFLQNEVRCIWCGTGTAVEKTRGAVCKWLLINNNSHTNLKLQYCSKTLLHVEVVRHSECK